MKRLFSVIALTAMTGVLLSAGAASLSETDAGIAASRWARKARLGVRLMEQRSGVRRYVTRRGDVFYGVQLGRSGSVVVADDGGRASVLAFTRQPLDKIDEASPLFALISRDLAVRAESIAARTATKADDESDIDDLRVSPFVKTKWNQDVAYSDRSVDASIKCYNYYTPVSTLTFKFDDDTVYKVEDYSTPCGCVATAMAQTMRYWKHPLGHLGIGYEITRPPLEADIPCVRNPDGSVRYAIALDLVPESVVRLPTLYNWSDMTECPLSWTRGEHGGIEWSGDPVGEDECKAIGELTYDCGVAVGLQYDFESTGLPFTNMANIAMALTNVFGYASAVTRDSLRNSSLTRDAAERARAVLANLDARRPVILLISGNAGGHAVIADGYGFAGEKDTPFVHLNMGWSGQCDIWYNLPSINVSRNPENFTGFSAIVGVVYNIAPDDDMVGEIVSGRAVDEDGNPIEGVAVEAYDVDGSFAGGATTDARGVYSIALPPSAGGYDIFAAKGDNVGSAYTGRVAESCDDEVGNSWGNDLSMGLPRVRAGGRLFSGFSDAVGYAQRKGDPLVEVLRPCSLSGDLEIYTNLTIVATNSLPYQSPVVCDGYTAPLKVTDGARLLLSNLVVSAADLAGAVNVDVAAGSRLAVAGLAVVDTVTTADAEGFEIAGPLEGGVVLKCAAAKVAGEKFGTVFAGGEDYAAYIFNGYDIDLAGAADGTDLKWAGDIPVPVEAAFVVFDDGSTPAGYRSFDAMLAYLDRSGKILLKRTCRFGKAEAVISSDCVLMSENADRLIVDGGSFVVNSGAGFVVSNVVVTGSSPLPFVTLGASKDSTGNLVLADGASIVGYANTGSGLNSRDGGAVYVKYGEAKLLPGSLIDGCSVTYAQRHGGGVYLYGYYASLELAGGSVSNCVGGGVGGGVYAAQRSVIRVTGPSAVGGNFYRNADGDTPSDVYLDGGDSSRFVLKGDAAGGLIGVDLVAGSVGAPEIGDAFMTVDVDPQTATNSARAFFSDDVNDITGAVSEDASQLVWVAAGEEQCEPDRAIAIVVYDDGGETNYYANVGIALDTLRGDATIYIVTNRSYVARNNPDWSLGGDRDILYNVRLCTIEGASRVATIYRASGSLFVRSGAKLTLSNIAFTSLYFGGGSEIYAAIAVDGGELAMEDGAVISDFVQYNSRSAGAVNVYNGGVLRMSGGEIRNSTNLYSRSESDYSVGAGVLVDNATAYFEGGRVVDCAATRYAGVYVGNGGKAYVSGAFTANGNTAGRAASNFAVQDLSHLYLTAPLSGSVGITDGVRASTNVFGEVGCELTPEVATSAANFTHDTNGETGAVATNAEGRAFLVWPSAFPDGEDSFEEDGVVYYRVETTPPPPPPPPGYTIHYIGGVGVSGEMDDTECLYGKVYNLRKCTLTKGGARFVGWAWNGRLYDDGILIFNLSDVDGDELDFVAVWE